MLDISAESNIDIDDEVDLDLDSDLEDDARKELLAIEFVGARCT